MVPISEMRDIGGRIRFGKGCEHVVFKVSINVQVGMWGSQLDL